ncbi:MAG: hypothetical protein ACI4B6_04910 [Atopobiaceae bacterium]
MPRLLAGAGKAEIDLEGILPFDGFDAQKDPIYARALVLESQGPVIQAGEDDDHDTARRMCLVCMDLTSIAPSLMTQLRQAAAAQSGCDGADLWVCATHTFSVPHVRTPSHLRSDAERQRNVRLLDAYVAAVADAVRQSVKSLRPASLCYAVGTTGVNVNRDVETPGGWWLGTNPAGYSDHSLRTLCLDSADGQPVAVLFSADVQSSVLMGSRDGQGRRLVSSDLAGFAAGQLERATGAVALFMVGAAGDQAPRQQAVTNEVASDGTVTQQDAHDEGFDMLERLGDQLSEELSAAVAAATPVEFDGLRAQQHQLSCPGQRRADFHSLAPHRSFEYLPADDVVTTVSALALGNLVLVGVEPEISSELGNRIRREGAAKGIQLDVLTMVNGGAKYLPDADAYQRVTYEAMNSGFAQGSDEVLVADVLRTAEELRAAAR